MKEDLRQKFWHIPFDVTLGQVFYLTLLICYYFIFNGIVSEEKEQSQIVNPDYQIVQVQSDNRRGNVFYSTPDFYLMLKNLLPDISSVMETETPIEYQIKEGDSFKRLKRNVNVILADENFFRMISGNLLNGETFDANDISSGKPVAVMTAGLAHDLFGENQHGSSLTINGREFLIKGTWSLRSQQIKENFTLILPISAVSILGVNDKTYINKFVLKGTSSKDLDRLKLAIDKIQLDAGQTPLRPEFTILELKVSRRFESIVNNQKVYWDIFLWVLSLYSLVRLGLDFNQRFFKFNEWIYYRKMAGMSSQHITDELQKEIKSFYLMFIFLSLILSSVILAFLHFIFLSRLSFGASIHLSFFVQLLGYGMLHYQIHGRVEQEVHSLSVLSKS